MIIYIRHGSDVYDDPTYAHDQKIVKNAENHEDIARVGLFLIEKYGHPAMTICSPFQRARDTYNVLKKKNVLQPETKLYVDTRVGRYFSSREKEAGPEVRKETLKMKPAIYESWQNFKARVQKHVDQLSTDGYLKSRHKVVWVITHTLVIKEVAKYLNFEMPEHYEFLQWACLRSHGPQYPISFLGIGDGAKDPDVLQIDLNRQKSNRSNMQKDKGKEKITEEVRDSKMRKSRKKRRHSDSDSSDSDEDKSGFVDDSDSSGYDDSGNISLDIEEENPKKKSKRKTKERRESRRVERKAEKKMERKPEKTHKSSRATRKTDNFTVEDMIEEKLEKEEAATRYKNRLKGKPLDEHINDHFKSQPQFRIVKDKFEKAKGGNIDDFVAAYNGNRLNC